MALEPVGAGGARPAPRPGRHVALVQHHVVHVALVAGLDERLEGDHVVLAGQLGRAVDPAPVVGVVLCRQEEGVRSQVPHLTPGITTVQCSDHTDLVRGKRTGGRRGL